MGVAPRDVDLEAKKMDFPAIHEYQDYRFYFQDFYRRSGKSHRFLAQRLHWPSSYLSDVIQGRKKLTLARAIEFSKFARMDVSDVERLIYLTLKDTENDEVRQFFSDRLNSEADANGYFRGNSEKEPLPEDFQVIPEEIYKDLSLLAIYECINWSRGQVGAEAIADLLYTFPVLKNTGEMQQRLQTLEKHGIIKINRSPSSGEPYFETSGKRLFFALDKNSVFHLGQYSQNLLRFISHPQKKGWLNSGFIKIPRARMAQVKKRLLLFRNWLNAIDQEGNDSSDSLVFQFDINLISLLNLSSLNIDSLNYWMANTEPDHQTEGRVRQH